jgi:hypothetical protein
MVKQSYQQKEQTAIQADPFRMLAELFIKIDQREKVIEKIEKGKKDDEDNQRSANRADKATERLNRVC